MGLVQAFPAERGKLDLAKMIVEQRRLGRPDHHRQLREADAEYGGAR